MCLGLICSLLHAGLKPSLITISSPDSSKLTVTALEGLARLLELLTNYFKVEIGRKLLDHLKSIAGPEVLEEAASRPLSEVEKIQILVGIIKVFALLPPKANIFLEELVENVVDLEVKLRRYRSSPFRGALLKYLNRYPEESVELFFNKRDSPGHNRLLVGILASPGAGPIREQVMKICDVFMSKTLLVLDNEEAQLQGILIIRAINEYNKDWVPSSAPLMKSLVKIWRGAVEWSRMSDSGSTSKQGLIGNILPILIEFCERSESEVGLLFDMVDGLDLNVSYEQDGLKK
jgi:transformation/transcription domain-associated protein